MHVEIVEDLRTARPAAARGRVHHLNEAPVPAPHHDEVRRPIGMARNDERGQCIRFSMQQVIDGEHHLLGIQSQLLRHLFHRVDGGPIHVGLAGFAQTTVTHGDAEALAQAFERGRAAVHHRGLHHLGREKPALGRVLGHNCSAKES